MLPDESMFQPGGGTRASLTLRRCAPAPLGGKIDMDLKKQKILITSLLSLFIIVELLFQIWKETDWLNSIQYLKFYLQYIRSVMAFSILFLGLYIQITKKNYEQKPIEPRVLIFSGFIFSALSVAPAILSLYFLNQIDLSLLPPEELSKTNGYIDVAKGYIRNMGILFSVFFLVFVYYLKNTKKPHNK